MVRDPMYHKSVDIAHALEAHGVQVEILCFFETQWHQYLEKFAHELKGVFYDHPKDQCLIILNDRDYIGSPDKFTQWALYNYAFEVKEGTFFYEKKAIKSQVDAFNASTTSKFVYMNIASEGITEQVVFELFSNLAPKTCQNFISLCCGFKRASDSEEITYANTEIHRIVPGMFIQGGRVKALGNGAIFE